jgi:two-component system, chemotaxis family, protein-glutamate methylesterase/glutaminase
MSPLTPWSRQVRPLQAAGFDAQGALVSRHAAGLVPGAGHSHRNRTIGTLFISVARHAGPRTIGVVLSGSLDDGSRGLDAIHKARGLTMVLDPGHKPRGMQQNAIDFDGRISFIGTAKEIAAAIGRVLAESRKTLRSS